MKGMAHLPYWPRVLRRELAATYLGLSPSAFDNAVNEGTLPAPVPVYGTVKGWDRADLDAWVENQKTADTGRGWAGL
jgi:predicted DNA-binding transcriptional regulator AlpA